MGYLVCELARIMSKCFFLFSMNALEAFNEEFLTDTTNDSVFLRVDNMLGRLSIRLLKCFDMGKELRNLSDLFLSYGRFY